MFKIKSILRSISKKNPSVIFMRHAEKYPETINKEGFFCNGITDSGRLAARNLSEQLHDSNIRVIKTSPVKRCIETSKTVADYSNENLNMEKTTTLGNPGAYIVNDKIAANAFLNKVDVYMVIKKYCNDRVLPGFAHIDVGTNIILKLIYNDLLYGESSLYISHDFILGVLIANLVSNDLFLQQKIDYLEGVVFTLAENNRLVMHLENNKFYINKNLNEV